MYKELRELLENRYATISSEALYVRIPKHSIPRDIERSETTGEETINPDSAEHA